MLAKLKTLLRERLGAQIIFCLLFSIVMLATILLAITGYFILGFAGLVASVVFYLLALRWMFP